MSKRLIILLALAFVFGAAFSAYAEVQNVKVSGDLTFMGVYRDNLDLAKERTINSNTTTEYIEKSDTYKNAIMQARIRVDADLTDNVSTTVRLLNERTWGDESYLASSSGDSHSDSRVTLDLAYATMKEFLYSPLSVTVGRQEMHFGNDMIIGDPDTNGLAVGSALPLYEQDLSLRKSFDAVRATFDYNPLVVDIIWSKIKEGSEYVNDDTTLSGINANYALNKQTTLEGYFFSKIKDTNSAKALTTTVSTKSPANKADKVFTVGGRVHNTSIKNLALGVESAFQFGNYNPLFDINGNASAGNSVRRAWALEAMANYDLKDVKHIGKYAPSVGVVYGYFSGENGYDKKDDKTYHGWDSMYENQTFGHLLNAIMGMTNCSLVGLTGKMKPVDDVTMKIDYYNVSLNKGFTDGTAINFKGYSGANTYYMEGYKRHLGQEVDATLTYDYTEDVQLSLLGGIFVPGSAFKKATTTTSVSDDSTGGMSVATEVIGSMKVTF